MTTCDVCDKPAAVDGHDVMPKGWYIVYAYNNDDGNNVPYYEVCGVDCLKIAALKQRYAIIGKY